MGRLRKRDREGKGGGEEESVLWYLKTCLFKSLETHTNSRHIQIIYTNTHLLSNKHTHTHSHTHINQNTHWDANSCFRNLMTFFIEISFLLCRLL